MNQILKRVDILCRHIEEVQRNCKLLGERLIEKGKVDLGLKLIANGLVHDASKFEGIEWQYLFTIPENSEDEKNLSLAIHQHNSTNLHHPEAWNGIKNMPDVYLAEMVCDVCARASEFGTDVRQWIDKSATKKYKFNKQSKTYKDIQVYLNLLLEKPFEKIS